MDDPWEVKNVKQGTYQSCMRLNGVPLLPPVLSKECRKEMQYYKLLAQEVERRIKLLKSCADLNLEESSDDQTDAPEIPDSEQSEPQSPEALVDKAMCVFENNAPVATKLHQDESTDCATHDSKLFIALNLTVTENRSPKFSLGSGSPSHLPKLDELPERDYDFQKEQKSDKDPCKVSAADSIPLPNDGPSSLSSKSFTGSLHDIHTESLKEVPKLIRQRSYTLLTPSPQLLAHLETQSQNTGVDMSSISMTESKSHTNLCGKKRRIWDLETAKVKWSAMALELKNSCHIKKFDAKDDTSNGSGKAKVTKSEMKRASPYSTGSKSYPITQNNNKKPNMNTTSKVSRSETATPPKMQKKSPKVSEKSPAPPATQLPTPTMVQNKIAPKNGAKTPSTKKEETNDTKPSTPISESPDPAARVKALYEKLQQQQLQQMASLVEKQRREQQLLQQVFEEQNNVLLKQLKTVCPAASIEVKRAWGEAKDDTERGPVSLSQLINDSPQSSLTNSPVSKTLTQTNNYINKCETVLKQSRDITNNIKKTTTPKARALSNGQSSCKAPNSATKYNRNLPTARNTSRRLNYDTSASSDNTESVLTDQTNDTMADLNVTFPSDSEQNSQLNRLEHAAHVPYQVISNSPPHSPTTGQPVPPLPRNVRSKSESAPAVSPQERAAASTIVAHAKGYLVRRLLRTERVQGIVQTIRDALLCALQLHQDREGIRGADVDLHRRLIQQITAACYSLHETFVSAPAAERCALIAADRARRQAQAARLPPWNSPRADVMSQSHSGAFPARARRSSAADPMTQSNYGKPSPRTPSAPRTTTPPTPSPDPKRAIARTRPAPGSQPAPGAGSGADPPTPPRGPPSPPHPPPRYLVSRACSPRVSAMRTRYSDPCKNCFKLTGTMNRNPIYRGAKHVCSTVSPLRLRKHFSPVSRFVLN